MLAAGQWCLVCSSSSCSDQLWIRHRQVREEGGGATVRIQPFASSLRLPTLIAEISDIATFESGERILTASTEIMTA